MNQSVLMYSHKQMASPRRPSTVSSRTLQRIARGGRRRRAAGLTRAFILSSLSITFALFHSESSYTCAASLDVPPTKRSVVHHQDPQDEDDVHSYRISFKNNKSQEENDYESFNSTSILSEDEERDYRRGKESSWRRRFVKKSADVVGGLAERFLSSESLEAVKSVQDILRSVEDHGVEVDVFRRHRKRDLIASIYALAKLQSACQHLRQSRQEEIGDTVSNDLLKELAYFAKFSTAAYGWTLELATRGAAHRGDSTRALCTRTGVSEDDIVLEEWDSQPNRPATYIVRDHKSKSIVVGVRGTWSGHDVLVDLSCTSEEYQVALQKYRAHKGMLDAARGVDQLAKDIVEKEFENYPDYKLIICGHSMGGSVAAILGTLWRKSFQQSIKVYAYGPACTFPLENKDDEKDNALSIVSVLNEGDPFSCLSLGHVADLSYCLDRLCDDGDLRSTILWRTDGKTPEMEERDLQWCEESLLKLKQRPSNDQSTAKNTLYPPGKLILLRTDRHDDKIHDRWMEPRKIPFKNRARKGCYAQPVPKSAFQDLVIGPRMVDLTRHVPKLYESRLHECLDNALATGTS